MPTLVAIPGTLPTPRDPLDVFAVREGQEMAVAPEIPAEPLLLPVEFREYTPIEALAFRLELERPPSQQEREAIEQAFDRLERETRDLGEFISGPSFYSEGASWSVEWSVDAGRSEEMPELIIHAVDRLKRQGLPLQVLVVGEE